MRRPSFESASGLRPATAFILIGCVFLVVVARAFVLVEREREAGDGPSREVTRTLPAPDFDLVDREGRALAMSIQRMDLRCSPRAMWQAHTPRHMAEVLAPFLKDAEGQALEPDEVLRRILPTERDSGWISTQENGWLLDYSMAARTQDWIDREGLGEGFSLERREGVPLWELWWRPEVVLSEDVRNAHGAGTPPKLKPTLWARRVADGLGRCLWPDHPAYEKKTRFEELQRQRDRIWEALMPSAEALVLRGVDSRDVDGLLKLLAKEKVWPHQMRVDFQHERVYPTRDTQRGEGAFALVGAWRHLSEDEAKQRAREAHPGTSASELRLRGRSERELLARRFPRSGLEGAGARLLEATLGDARPAQASYTFLRNRTALHGGRSYFVGDVSEGETPVVRSTLDASLQSFLHDELLSTLAEHDAALTMGIVVDVESGDVLAIDGVSAYTTWEFLPTWHLFTPGSTFKAIIMAAALDAGVVSWAEPFDTHDGSYLIPGSHRRISEAQNAPTGIIPAWQGLASSVNAVLVQIGMRVDARRLHDKLVALGYGRRPDSAVGGERAGSLPDLPWSASQTHASLCFGHEISVSLWQHAAALATVLRGGQPRPLRILEGAQWGGGLFTPEAAPAREPVFDREACETVRAMMRKGALVGTGRHIQAREAELGTPLFLLSKTGTTEKEDRAPCLHLELERNQNNLGHAVGSPGFETFKEMKARQLSEGTPHARACYTSSICLAGSVPGEERELMTLIVVEEPRGKGKFGSDVAGPTGIRVLKEALGLTRAGLALDEYVDRPVDYGYAGATQEPGVDRPWAWRPGGEW